MKTLLFLVVLFFATPVIHTNAILQSEMTTESVRNHGIVIVSQGRDFVKVEVSTEGAFRVDLIAVSTGKVEATREGVDRGTFRFSTLALQPGIYLIVVQCTNGYQYSEAIIVV